MNESTKRPRAKKGQKLTPKVEEYFAKQVEKAKNTIEEQETKLLKEDSEGEGMQAIREGRAPLGMLKALTNKSIEEIVYSGTTKEVAYLVSTHSCAFIDGDSFPITGSDVLGIYSRLSLEEIKEVNIICSYILALKLLEEKVSYSVLMFQKDAAHLAKSAQEWEGYERLAEALTDLYRSGALGSGLTQERLEEIASSIKLEHRCSIHFDSSSDSFKVDIGDVEDGHSLRRQIRMRRAFVQESMRDVKAKEEAIKKYIKEKELPIEAIPFTNRVCFNDMEEEIYLRGLFDENKFFCSKLSKHAGTQAEEDVEKAVFPSYKAIKPLKSSVEAVLSELRRKEKEIRDEGTPLIEKEII